MSSLGSQSNLEWGTEGHCDATIFYEPNRLVPFWKIGVTFWKTGLTFSHGLTFLHAINEMTLRTIPVNFNFLSVLLLPTVVPNAAAIPVNPYNNVVRQYTDVQSVMLAYRLTNKIENMCANYIFWNDKGIDEIVGNFKILKYIPSNHGGIWLVPSKQDTIKAFNKWVKHRYHLGLLNLFLNAGLSNHGWQR